MRPALRSVIGAALAAILLLGSPAHAAPPPLLLSDDFTDGDAAGWRTTGGTWAVTDAVFQQTTPAARAVARVGDPTWTDLAVSARVRQDTGVAAAVLARIQPDGSHYYLSTRA